MIWAGFCFNQQLLIQIIINKMNILSLCKMLKTSLKAFIEEKTEFDINSNSNTLIFHQDNVLCYIAYSTKT